MPSQGQEETVRIVAMDRSFHIGCYKCEVRGNNKEPSPEIHRLQDIVYVHTHACVLYFTHTVIDQAANLVLPAIQSK